MNDDAAPQAAGWTSLLDRLWRLLASPRLTVILLVWVAVVLALSKIIPQVPSNVDDPVVRSQWLANLPTAARPVVERFLSVGVFDLLDTIWLRLPLVLLLAHALVVLANWGQGIWYRVRCQPSEVSPLGKSFQLERDWREPVENAEQRLKGRLEEAGYLIPSPQRSDTTEPDQSHYVATRWRWIWLGLAGVYVGLALASVGLILTGWLGEVHELILAPNKPYPLPVSAVRPPDLVLEETTVKGDDPLRPKTGVAMVNVSSGVGESQDLVLALHNSRLLRGMWVTLTDLRPMVELIAVDLESDEPVLLQRFSPRTPAQEGVRVPLMGDPETRFVGVPTQNVTLYIGDQAEAGSPASARQSPLADREQSNEGSPNPFVLISFYQGAESATSYEASLHSGDAVDFEGVRYQVVTVSYDATLRLRSTLWWIAAAGWGVTVVSLIALVVAPPIYAQGSAEAAGKGSRVALKVDMLGDEAARRREFERLLLPPEGEAPEPGAPEPGAPELGAPELGGGQM